MGHPGPPQALRQLADWVANEEPALGMLFLPEHPLRLSAVGGAFIGHAAGEAFAMAGGHSHQLMHAIANHALRGRQREIRALSTLAQATWMVGQR